MEEKKTLKIKKPRLIIFALAIAFAIMGFIDLKANAAENLVEDIPVEEQYMQVDYYLYDYVNKYYERFTYNWSNPSSRIAIYYGDFTDKILDPSNTNNVIESTGKGYRLCVARDENNSSQYWYGNSTYTKYDKDEVQTSFDTYDRDYDMSLFNADEYAPTDTPNFKDLGTYVKSMKEVAGLSINTNIPIFTDWDSLREYLETGFYNPSGVVIDWSEFLKNASVNDNIPCVTNVHFDKIESKESFAKTITDYITFDSNPNYRLAIMLCPSVYSTVRSNDFIGKFDVYKYDKWVFMITSDIGLKEISCNIGTFSIPTSGVESIVDSNYKSYYESILYGLSDNGSVNFVPTMGYRLAYVDLSNNQIGPSTYILPNYYDNLDPDDEAFSFFTLYSDGTKGSEKVMNLKTWQEEEFISLDDAKDVINKVNDKLNDYQIIDSDLGVGEATSWLQSVASFIKGTPSFVASVMAFLPEPVRYGMFVCLFLGVIASGYAIVKALI